MKTMQSLHLLALLAASANAFPGGSFTFYGMSGCNGDSSFQFKEAYPTSNVQCTSVSFHKSVHCELNLTQDCSTTLSRRASRRYLETLSNTSLGLMEPISRLVSLNSINPIGSWPEGLINT